MPLPSPPAIARAEALWARGDAAGTEAALREHLLAAPQDAACLARLGHVLLRRGADGEAARCLRQSLALLPEQAAAWRDLALVSLRSGAAGEAHGAAAAALALQPADPGAHLLLGQALARLGRDEEALAALRQAVALAPRAAPLLLALAQELERQRRLGEELVATYARLVDADPSSPQALQWLGLAQYAAERPAESVATFRRLRQQHPQNLLAQWMCFQVPERPWFDSEDERAGFRQRWIDGLSALEQADLSRAGCREEAQALLGSAPHFALAYLGQADVDLHRRCAALLGRLLACATGAALPQRPLRRISRRRRRIALVSRFLREHAVTRAWGEALLSLPREDFELCVLYADDRRDAVTARFRERADVYFDGDHAYPVWSQRLWQLDADVVLFLDLGLSQIGQALALGRYAPVQATTWAHPVTSGMPNVDFFLSSDLAEPADANLHYSERLVRLPHLGGHFPAADALPEAPRSGPPQLVCAQALKKLHPLHDHVFARIARECPDARFSLLTNAPAHQAEGFRRRLESRLRSEGVDPARFRVEAALAPAEYRQALSRADVVLDSFDFSGGITSLDALGLGRPIVTLPGALLRGRQTLAMLRRLDLAECIARDLDDYVAQAVRLAADSGARQRFARELRERRGLLFGDRQVDRALAQFLATVEHPSCG